MFGIQRTRWDVAGEHRCHLFDAARCLSVGVLRGQPTEMRRRHDARKGRQLGGGALIAAAADVESQPAQVT